MPVLGGVLLAGALAALTVSLFLLVIMCFSPELGQWVGCADFSIDRSLCFDTPLGFRMV